MRSWSCFHVYAVSKQTDSRAVLPTKENLKILVKLCDSARIVNDEEGTSTVAFQSARALSILVSAGPDDICASGW